MSESETALPDLSGVIDLLLSRPDLIEKIRALLKTEGVSAPAPDTEAVPEVKTEPVSVKPAPEAAEKANRPSFLSQSPADRDRRHKLILALKPYLSENRARLLDSFEAVVGIVDVIRPGIGG